MTTQVGYARVSTGEQTLDLQLDALTAAGCDRVFRDTASGAKVERPGLGKAVYLLRPGARALRAAPGRLARLPRPRPRVDASVRSALHLAEDDRRVQHRRSIGVLRPRGGAQLGRLAALARRRRPALGASRRGARAH